MSGLLASPAMRDRSAGDFVAVDRVRAGHAGEARKTQLLV